MATVRLEIVEGSFAPFAPKTVIEVRRSSTAQALTVALAGALAQTHLDFDGLLRAVRSLGYIESASDGPYARTTGPHVSGQEQAPMVDRPARPDLPPDPPPPASGRGTR